MRPIRSVSIGTSPWPGPSRSAPSFIAGSIVGLQQFGFGLAAAILIDVTIVRSLLVPALTFELGERVWWPSALERRRRKTAARTGVTEAAEPAIHASAE